jgi:hypothetical protein
MSTGYVLATLPKLFLTILKELMTAAPKNSAMNPFKLYGTTAE